MREHTIWAEKFRPISIDDYLAQDDLKKLIKKFIKEQDVPHLLLYGPPGCGKTTLAKLLVNSIDCDYIYLNASDERGMDVMRDKVKGFASTASFRPLKVVILDECLTGDTLVKVIRDGIEIKVPISELNEETDLAESYNFDKGIKEWKPFYWWEKKEEELFEIEFENNEIIRCTGEHKWFVLRNDIREVVKTKDLTEDDEIVNP